MSVWTTLMLKLIELLSNYVMTPVRIQAILLSYLTIPLRQCGAWVAQWLRRCASSRTVPVSIPGGVTGDFFPWYPRQNHVPWGRLSLWKWVPGIFPGVKAAGAYGWPITTLVVPNVKIIRGLNLPGPLGPLRPVAGDLYFFLPLCQCEDLGWRSG